MTHKLGNTFRGMLMVTVASGLMIGTAATASAGMFDFLKKDEESAQTFQARRPNANPNGGETMTMQTRSGGVVARRPEANPGGPATGMDYRKMPENEMGEMQLQQEFDQVVSEPAPAPQQKKGLFDWMYKDGGAGKDAPVATMQRRVPVGNQNPTTGFDAPTQSATFEAAVPVEDVQMAPLGGEDDFMMEPMTEPQMAADASYPELGNVPPRPERLDAMGKKDAMMAELEGERSASQAMQADLAMQVDAEMGGASAGVPEDNRDLNAEFAALVSSQPAPAADPSMNIMPDDSAPLEPLAPMDMASNDYEMQPMEAYAEPVAMEPMAVEPAMAPMPAPQAPAPQHAAKKPSGFFSFLFREEQGGEMPQVDTAQRRTPQGNTSISGDPLPVGGQQMASIPAGAVPVEPVQSWEAQPLAPQAPVADEWVDLRQDPAAQAAVPVQQVSIGNTPQPASVSAVPVVPEWNGGGNIVLTPPSGVSTHRTLPESRYAARRQAVYMYRYGRR